MSQKVIFACVHNAGRSQMAAAFFNALVEPGHAQAICAGTRPGNHLHPVVLHVMSECGIDLSHATPQRLTPELAHGASLLVTMGCGEECPVVPGAEHRDWPLDDPRDLPLEHVRVIRDAIRVRVQQLLSEKGWNRPNH
jgi:arsenate reductase (thioredoxin)